jgi:cytoskeletal protein RodZ
VQFFRSARLPPDPDVEKAHQELRDKSVKFLRMPLRVLAMLVSLYFSWQFMDWKAITPSSFETLVEEKQITPSTKGNTSTASSPVVDMAESAKSALSSPATTGSSTATSTFDESQWEKFRETKTCELGWKTSTSVDGWCSLGEFPAGEYRFETR